VCWFGGLGSEDDIETGYLSVMEPVASASTVRLKDSNSDEFCIQTGEKQSEGGG
jgi:hypothetical protein